MKPPPPPPYIVSEHRLARFTIWLIALLAWCARGVVSPRRRRSHGVLTIEKLRRYVRAMIIIRAAQLISPFHRRRVHLAAPHGFRLITRRATLRRIAGRWLRRRLVTRGGFVAQVKHLISVLRSCRELAAQLAYRRRFGLSRLMSIVPARPPQASTRFCAATAPQAVDTS